MSRHEMRAFLADRRRAFLSDDPAVWRAYADRYGVQLPTDPELLRLTIDKARTAVTDLPIEVRRAAADRLRAIGWEPLDDGELDALGTTGARRGDEHSAGALEGEGA